MIGVTFDSDAGPIEGFVTASIRTGVNTEGVGSITVPPEIADEIAGPVRCRVDGQVVFVWTPEDRNVTSDDAETVTISGRGRASALERAIVLPVGYPAFTDRSRTETGAPLAVLSTLLAEAQGRGRVTDLAPSWTATHDSNGDPWTEQVSVTLEPGTNLRELLDSLSEVEGAEWAVRPDGTIDAAPQLGDDRSAEVVLFYGRDQLSRTRRSSSREQRQTIFIEASTGVSEATNTADADAGELWLEAQDYADPISRQALADKTALKLGAPEEEADVVVPAEARPFVRFRPGDLVGLDSGSGAPEPVRVVAISLEVGDQVDVRVEATLLTEVALRAQRIERAIQAKADVQLAASPSIQRRHGLVTADKFLSGAVGDAVAISSENYVPGQDGWAILGNGNAEFNDATFRGDLQSDNYVPGVSGWFLDRDGNAEFEEGLFRGVVTTEGDIIIPPGAPAPGLGEIRARSIVDAGRTIYEIGLGAYPQSSFFEAGSIFADPTDTVVVNGERQVGNTDLVGLGLAQQEGAAFLAGLRNETQAIGPWRFVPDIVRGTQGVTFVASPTAFDASSPITISPASTTTSTLLTVRGRSSFQENVTISGGTTQTRALRGEGSNTYSISNYRDISADRDIGASRNVFVGNQLTVQGQGIVNGNFTVFGSSTLLDSSLIVNGQIDFFISQSGAFFRHNQAGAGSQGGEPTLDTSNDQFGFVGIPTRRMFRMHAGQFLTSSESRLKGEIVDADLDYCYETVRSMRLTRYSMQRDREDYYSAKGEWIMGDRDDFVDRGGPQRKLGIIAEEAPDEVADETHMNVDIYAYSSLIAGAVKRLQERVEALEGDRG
jgi:hypothetical protein